MPSSMHEALVQIFRHRPSFAADVPNQARRRITECTDLEQLDLWIRRRTARLLVHDAGRA